MGTSCSFAPKKAFGISRFQPFRLYQREIAVGFLGAESSPDLPGVARTTRSWLCALVRLVDHGTVFEFCSVAEGMVAAESMGGVIAVLD